MFKKKRVLLGLLAVVLILVTASLALVVPASGGVTQPQLASASNPEDESHSVVEVETPQPQRGCPGIYKDREGTLRLDINGGFTADIGNGLHGSTRFFLDADDDMIPDLGSPIFATNGIGGSDGGFYRITEQRLDELGCVR